ncbi:DUF1579 domain-containing protein [Stieleria varia]|uniref:DUF1579 domain-containing protein n=1 Tax=Stieleria varia TaxID=2528005 RepID=A0A5C6A5X5_9BACT|nr:DUF1579 domain-containing protein [Stieleria varia]TWT93733.1 hypothetical protein Pla52n_55610 [Stieleria varia]
MFSKPQQEHVWLDRLVGQWKFEHECEMPDGSKTSAQGLMNCRSLGGLWLICESSGDSPDGQWSSIMTLGFDPTQNQYVGTFIGSMMANIWPYHGVLDPAGNRLPLYSEGPKFDGSGLGKYRDTIETIDADTWLFISEIQTDSGEWKRFMLGSHTRA